MNYVNHLNMFGVEAKEIPCIKGEGEPTEETKGAVGCFYMDVESGDVYKCTSVEDGSHTWEETGVDMNKVDERIDERIGDVENALDDLHTYADDLVTGGA